MHFVDTFESWLSNLAFLPQLVVTLLIVMLVSATCAKLFTGLVDKIYPSWDQLQVKENYGEKK